MDDGMDYDVQTKVSFRLDFDGSGEFNMLLLPDVQKQFVQHVKEVYEKDNTLGSGYVSSDLNFRFNGVWCIWNIPFTAMTKTRLKRRASPPTVYSVFRRRWRSLAARSGKSNVKLRKRT